jgi:hypothetical protein
VSASSLVAEPIRCRPGSEGHDSLLAVQIPPSWGIRLHCARTYKYGAVFNVVRCDNLHHEPQECTVHKYRVSVLCGVRACVSVCAHHVRLYIHHTFLAYLIGLGIRPWLARLC